MAGEDAPEPLAGPDPSNPALLEGPGPNIRPRPFGVSQDILRADILRESPNRPLFEQVLRNHGISTTTPDPFAETLKRLAPRLAVPLPETTLPTFEAFPQGTGGQISGSIPNLISALAHGFSESPMGSLTRYLQMRQGAEYENQPGYDPFRDPQIAQAGLTNQMQMFFGSGSPSNTRWLIQRIQEKQSEGERIDRMGGGAAAAQFMGGLLGDPLTYLPSTLGVKAAQYANKMRLGTMAGSELKAVSQPLHVTLGTIADGVKYAGVTGALQVAERALENGMDPTMSINEVVDSLYVPMAIAGSLTMVMSAMMRRTARGLAQEVKSSDFLKGTPPSGARYVPDEFVGPVRHPTDEAAAALRSEYDDATTRARRMERVDHDQTGGPRSKVPFNGLPNDGNLAPGSLATDYGDILKRERAQDAQTAAIVAGRGPDTVVSQVGAPAGARVSGKLDHELPADASGARELVLNGQSRSAAEFPVGHLMSTPEGQVWRVNDVDGTKRFVLFDKQVAGRRGFLDEAAPKPLSKPPDLQAHLKEGVEVDASGRPYTKADYEHRGERVLSIDGFFVGSRSLPAADLPVGTTALDYNGVEWQIRKTNDPSVKGGQIWGFVSENPKPRAGPKRLVDQVFAPGELERADEAAPGSVGAALSPQSQVYQREVLLAQGRMAPTGIGLEKLPLDPVARVFMGMSVAAMRVVSDLVSTGGRLTVGNLQGIGNLPPIEAIIRANWDLPVVNAVRAMHDDWAAYRHAIARGSGQLDDAAVDFSGRSDFRRLADEAGTAIKDKITRGETGLSFAEYRRRVAEALNNGDADELTDAASPYVARTAAAHRKVYDLVRDTAVEQRLFEDAYQKARFQAYSEVRAVKKEADEIARQANIERWSKTRQAEAEEALMARMEDAEFKAKQIEDKLDELRRNGPSLGGTATSYRPRMWDAGKLRDGEQRFISEILVPHLTTAQGGGHSVEEAARIAKQIHTTLARLDPVFERGDAERLFMSVASPDSAMARTLNIPDKMVKDFLVDDAEVLLRYHVQQMGTAIEMKKRFGNLDLAEQIAEIEQEYRGQIIEANRGSTVATDEAKRLTAMMKGDIRDVQALRDKLYGTYGAAVDPHAWTSRTIRMAKQFSNITLLGMSGVSALGDLVRPLMTEGLEAMYGYGIRSLMSDSRGTILRMAKADLEMAGTGMDLMKNVRALQAHDTGDVFGSRGRIEHTLSTANQWMFIANGLNQITEFTKKWASVTIQGNMNKTLLDFGNDIPISAFDRTRLAANGIDEPLARRIALQLKIHGQEFADVGNGQFVLANLTAWKDELAAEAYKSALFQQVERTIATPGIGDRSNWISTEMGSLIGQYKSWGMAMMTRSLYSGLQEGGSRFWYGAAGMVGFAILLNEMRSRLFYDKSTFDRPATAVIADGVDRSSILGWFSDANRAVETLTGNRLGVKPLLGASQPQPLDATRIAGTVGGPASGQAFRAAGVVDDFLSGHPTSRTYANWRTLLPGNTLPYLDPAFDHAISDGNYRRGLERRRTQQPAG